jgi:CDP-diglyceride synthetase
LKAIYTRSLSGAIYVASILVPLLLFLPIYPFVIGIYGVFVVMEIRSLQKKVRTNHPEIAVRPAWIAYLTMLGWGVVPLLSLALLPFAVDALVWGQGAKITLALFVIVWVHDTFAYLTGITVGKHPLAPTISPAKTVEGAVGGLLFAGIAAVLISLWVVSGLSWLFWGGGVLLIVLLANLGDLAESKMKRLAGVKDSGNRMPGHGGFFDRFDALLFTAPLWLLWIWWMA